MWTVALLPIHALLFWAMRGVPEAVEAVYGTLYPGLAWLRRWLDVTPLSPAWTLGLAIVAALVLVARRAERPGRDFGWRLVVTLAALVHAFPLAWGLNYLRPSAPTRLGLTVGRVPMDDYAVSARKVVDAANAARIEWDPPAPAELDRRVDAAVRDLLNELGLDEAAFPRRIRFLPPGTMLVGGWHGVTIPHTTEAWVDPAVEPRDLPHVIAHEKIHQAGFARESDANFLAWLALTRADDPHLRYSTLFFVLDLFAPHAPQAQATQQVQADLQAAQQHVEQVRVEAVVETTHEVYDAYLKASTVEAGVTDYDLVAEAIHAWLDAHPDWLTR